MDFMERLNDKINEIPQLPLQSRLGYLGATESLVLYPLPGSRTVEEYMDGTKEKEMNYEIAMKSKSQQKINDVLWLIQNELDDMDTIGSHNGSFTFNGINITNLPFINQLDDQGWFVFLLNIQAELTIFEEETING